MFKSLAWILCALPLAATGLDTLRTQLRRPSGTEALKASVTFQTWTRRGDAKRPLISQGRALAWVEDGPQGLKLLWSRDMLQKSTREAQAQSLDPEQPIPTRDAMFGLDVLKLQDYFEPAARLLRDLDQARLLEERPDTLDGHPCTLLVLKLEPKIDQREKKYVKDLDASARIWLDGDGLPLALDSRVKVHGKALLVISFDTDQHEHYRFQRINGRLVTVRHALENTSSGAGESGETRKVAELTFN